MFNENSGLVQIWVKQINSGEYTIDQVPNISNLKDVVQSLVTE